MARHQLAGHLTNTVSSWTSTLPENAQNNVLKTWLKLFVCSNLEFDMLSIKREQEAGHLYYRCCLPFLPLGGYTKMISWP